MPGKISEMTASAGGTDAMLVEVVQGGANLKMTGTQWVAWLVAKALTWTAQQIYSNGSGLTARFIGTSSGSGTVAISLEQTGAAQKNFCFSMSHDALGWLSLRSSTADGGDPYAAGTTNIILPVGALGNYASDAAAAAASVPIKGVYRNGSVLMIRVA